MKEKSRTELYNEKVSLIYEYDKKSPLFVRMAHIELEKNNIERAVDILNNGLKIYPYFPSAHLLLGKAFTQLGSYGHAIRSFKAGSELIKSKKTFDYYFNEIESRKKERSYFEVTRRTSFLAPGLDYDELEQSEPEAPAPPPQQQGIDDRLEQIAEDIKKVKIIPSSHSKDEIKDFEEIDHRSLIISETLAKIYLTQGEFKEAIETYKRLIKKTPEKEEYYLSKIEEIKKQFEL
jgi:tetratricopeptide (TPR) repeat protein